MTDIPERESLITYPCDFPIKVMGRAHEDLVGTLVEVVRGFDPGFDPGSVVERPSSRGTYVGLTFVVRVESREQLDDLYRALHGHHMVSVVL